jgi:hypothetical protein
MRFEAGGQAHFHPYSVRGVVGVLFAAFVAADLQTVIEFGGLKCIGLAQRDHKPGANSHADSSGKNSKTSEMAQNSKFQ